MHMLSTADQVIVCIIHVPWNLHNDREREEEGSLVWAYVPIYPKTTLNMICKAVKYLSDLHTHPRNCYTERILLTVDEKNRPKMCVCKYVSLYIIVKHV